MAGKADIKSSVVTKKSRNKLWSKQEIKTLRRLYPCTSGYQLVRILNRTPFSIYGMAYKLGLHKKFDDKFRPYRPSERMLWSDEEKRILKKMYPSHTVAEISAFIGRTFCAIMAQVHKLKLKKVWLWTDKQCDYLRRFYGKKPAAEFAQMFGKTVAAVEAKAIDLGVAGQRGIPWTKRQVKMLIKYRPTMSLTELAKLTGHSRKGAAFKTRYLGIKRHYPVQKWTQQQDNTLKKYCKKLTHKQLADKLGRPFNAIMNRLCTLGLTRGSAWTKKDIAVLKKEFKKGAKVKEISKLLGKKELTCYYKIKALGLKRS